MHFAQDVIATKKIAKIRNKIKKKALYKTSESEKFELFF
jgi:hypothetical protein